MVDVGASSSPTGCYLHYKGLGELKENEEEEKKRRLQPPYGCELDPPLNRCFLNFSTSVIERDQTYELENCR